MFFCLAVLDFVFYQNDRFQRSDYILEVTSQQGSLCCPETFQTAHLCRGCKYLQYKSSQHVLYKLRLVESVGTDGGGTFVRIKGSFLFP